MKKILLIFAVLCAHALSAQNEAANWYFGNNAGITFDPSTNQVSALTDGQLSTEEGCTSISDSTGNLLFYTNGENVYDRQHNIMPNGTGLFGNQSSTQSAIIVPKPGDPNIYYIFTQDTTFEGTPDNGFNYSVVDITLNSGFGDVTIKNQFLLHKASEKLSAVLKDCESQNIWVVTFGSNDALTNSSATDTNNNTFYAFEVSATGINTTPVISSLPYTINQRRGYLKFSPDGTKLALANISDGLRLLDFDPATGTVSNSINIPTNLSPSGKPQSAYGVEFSPNNQVLYVSTYYETSGSNFDNPSAQYGALLQYDLTATNISATEEVLDERVMYRSALQLGPNGRIYRSLSATYDQGIPFLSVINSPNTLGQEADYQHAVIDLMGRSSRQGLPPFITSYFSEKIDIIPTDDDNTVILPLCTGDTYTLVAEAIPGAIYTWTKDEVAIPTPAIPYELFIDEAGNYEVIIDPTTSDCEIKEGQAIVSYYEIPVATQPSDLIICDDDNDATSTFDLQLQEASILNGQDPLQYNVQYYLSQIDADLDENQLESPYTNSNPIETIFARIYNTNNPNCFDTTSFNLEVYNTPTINTLMDYSVCDDTTDGDDTNGQSTVDLSFYNAQVYNSLSPAVYDISYHNTQLDADNNTNPLPTNYYNATPFTETIYVRLENSNNTDCYTTSSFVININPVPEANNQILFQCDEDGVPDGFTTFNLNQAIPDITNNATNTSTSFYSSMTDAETETNPLSAGAYNNASNPQTIYAVTTNTTSSCKAITEVILEVSVTQISDYTAPIVCDELGSEDGINTFNLEDFSTDMLTLLPPGITLNYYETYDDALTETNALPLIYNNTTPYNQTIYARAENNNACYGINQVFLTVKPLPQLSNDETLLYCLNQFPETIQLSASTPLNNTYYYLWSTGQTTASIAVNTVGTYTVTATTVDGCSKTKTIIVEPSNIATIDNIEVIDGNINNNIVTILASGEGEYLYEIINSEGLSLGYQESNTFNNVKPGFYSVNIKDVKNNCGVVNQLFSVVGFPLFFTPNNDGSNDYWQVYGVSSQFQPKSVIQIFDRYGKLLTQFTPTSIGWDGTVNGIPMPTNDYWFTVKLQDGRIYKNHFTLKR